MFQKLIIKYMDQVGQFLTAALANKFTSFLHFVTHRYQPSPHNTNYEALKWKAEEDQPGKRERSVNSFKKQIEVFWCRNVFTPSYYINANFKHRGIKSLHLYNILYTLIEPKANQIVFGRKKKQPNKTKIEFHFLFSLIYRLTGMTWSLWIRSTSPTHRSFHCAVLKLEEKQEIFIKKLTF